MGDSIQYATEMGRLDLVSALLAILGILLAIFGLIGFFDIRMKAEKIAKETAEKMATKIATEKSEQIVRSYLDKEFPQEIDAYLNAYDLNSVGPKTQTLNSEEFAEAQDDASDGK